MFFYYYFFFSYFFSRTINIIVSSNTDKCDDGEKEGFIYSFFFSFHQRHHRMKDKKGQSV